MHDAIDFLSALERKARPFAAGARTTFAAHESTCRWLLDPLARWTALAYGPGEFEAAARGYAQYCMHVGQAQRLYEKAGAYTPETLPEIVEHVYHDPEYMTPYMWAAVLIYAWWPSMVAHLTLYRDEFLRRLPDGANVLELACGHGVLGLLALEEKPAARLRGCDISPAAIDIARRLAASSGHAARASFEVRDVLDLGLAGEPGTCHGVVAAMIAEHLADPRPLFAAVAHHLAPGGRAFVSTALESPQRDHVTEFRRESEVLLLAEAAGLRVARLVCDGGTGARGGRFRPRALALVLEHA